MSVVYLDSNAFAKLYLDDETGQDRVLELVTAYGKVATCAIAYADVAGVFARAFHAGRLTEEGYGESMENFGADWLTTKIFEVTPELSSIAALLMKAHSGLRGMDALHLASALALRQSTPIKFLSFDGRLQAVAGKLMPEAISISSKDKS